MSSKISFNSEQKKAIDTFTSGKSVFVNASAGTGKTTMLVNAYINLLEKGILPKEIVAITFTEASANEMLKRIRDRIRENMYSENKDDYEKWRAIYNSVAMNGNISTIHAYAYGIIQKYGVHLCLSPNPQIVDSKDEIIKKILSSNIINIFLNTDEGKHIYKLMNLYIVELRDNFIEELIDFIGSIKPRLSSFEIFKKKTDKLFDIENNIEIIHEKLTDILYKITIENTKGSNAEKAKNEIYNLLENIKNYISSNENTEQKEIDDRILYLKQIEINKYGNLGKSNDIFKSLIEESKILAKEYSKKLFILYYKTYIKKFVSFLEHVFTEYEKIKTSESILTFDDIISKSFELLQNEKIKTEIRSEIKYIILDEAQDTSNLQYKLISMLIFGSENIDENKVYNSSKIAFIVGDRKQSIYRFRNADITAFLEYGKYFEKKEDASVVYLKTNYRSESLLLSFFNDFFQTCVFIEDNFINYNDRDNLVCGKESDSDKKIAYLILESKTKNGDKINAVENTELEAEAIARYIEKRKTESNIAYSDMALLLPTFTRISLYLNAFIKYNIPFYVTGGSGFYSRKEIYSLTTFLRYLILHEENLIISVLETGFFDLSISDLYRINAVLAENEMKLPDCFKKESEEVLKLFDTHKDIQNKLIETRNIILYLKKISSVKNIGDIIEEILTKTNFLLYIMTTADSEISYANIQKLSETGRLFERRTGQSAYDFVNSIKVLGEEDDSYAYVPLLEINAVRIMTIHGSKGLEFPFIAVGGLSNTLKYNTPKFSFIDDEAILPVYTTYEKTSICAIEKEDDKNRTISERKRFLYVALTRAKNELVLAGEKKDKYSYRDFFNTYFPYIVKYSTEDKNSEDIKDIYSVEENIKHSYITPYIFGRGIKNRITVNDKEIIEKKYKETINALNKKIELKEKKYSPKIIFGYASQNKGEQKNNIFDIEKMLLGGALYYEEHNGIITEEREAETEISLKDLGTQIHKCLEIFDYEKYKILKDIYINTLTDKVKASMINYDALQIENEVKTSLYNYLKSERALAILEGKESIVFRERSFEKRIKNDNGDINIMRAKIDLLTKDELGVYRLVDYKYSHYYDNIKNTYRKQIDIYNDFLSKLLNVNSDKIKSEILCLKDAVSVKF